jgi:hypothetical protein
MSVQSQFSVSHISYSSVVKGVKKKNEDYNWTDFWRKEEEKKVSTSQPAWINFTTEEEREKDCITKPYTNAVFLGKYGDKQSQSWSEIVEFENQSRDLAKRTHEQIVQCLMSMPSELCVYRENIVVYYKIDIERITIMS